MLKPSLWGDMDFRQPNAGNGFDRSVLAYIKKAAPKSAAFKNFVYSTISLATRTPLAEAWEREWVIPLPSPII